MKLMNYPEPLTREEEQTIFCTIETGEGVEKETAKQTLIEHNLRLVVYIANRYKGPRYDLEDLASIGTIGLIKAVNTFESDKKIKFATYASRCIQNEILMHFRKTKKTQQEISFETMLTQDSEGNSLSLLDIMGTEKNEIEEEIQEQETFDMIIDLINELDEDEKQLICYRFGIGTPKKKQKEIAHLLNISQSYVSRIEKRALQKIKQRYDIKEKLLFA